MHPVKKHLFDTNFKDLEGTRIEGTIALSDELINLGILDFLNGLKAGSTAPVSKSASAAPEAAPDPKSLLANLDIETLEIKAVDGRFLLKVKAGF
jgi:hypothetical protein